MGIKSLRVFRRLSRYLDFVPKILALDRYAEGELNSLADFIYKLCEHFIGLCIGPSARLALRIKLRHMDRSETMLLEQGEPLVFEDVPVLPITDKTAQADASICIVPLSAL